jgi:hypothetical protein
MPDDLDELVSDQEQAILDMVLALKKGDGAKALEVAETAYEGAAGRPALEARVLTWWAQALQIAGDRDGARARLGAALAKAEEAGDAAGVEAIQPLLAELAPAAARPAPSTTPVGLAVTAIDNGDTKRGELLALGAHRLAVRDGDVREQVLALLALARLPHRTHAAIEEAARVADESGDANLVTAVAKAAKAAGHALPKHVF